MMKRLAYGLATAAVAASTLLAVPTSASAESADTVAKSSATTTSASPSPKLYRANGWSWD